EALFITEKIQELVRNEGYAASDIAVLYRTNAQSRAIEDALMKSGVSYQMVGGTKFYDRKEIKDMIAYLRLIMNPDNDLNFERVVKVPNKIFCKPCVELFLAYATEHDISFYAAVK